MKKLLYLVLFLLPIVAFAQPANDDCSGLIDLGVAPYCTNMVFDNIDATASDIGYNNIPGCWANGSVDHDVWFKFTASDTIIDYTITLTGVTGPNGEPSIFGPQVAIYRGPACAFDNLALLACYNSNPTDSDLKFNLVGLDLGEMYFLRVNGVIAEGAFELCIIEREPITTIDIGGTTTECSGILYDTGGPDGNYGSNEDFTYSICPSFPSDQCVTFNLEYYHTQWTSQGDYYYIDPADQLIFYDGPDTNSPIIPFSGVDQNFLSADSTGAVCQTIQASSGCLTVQFFSDDAITYEGFAGNWTCSAEPCEPLEPLTIDQGATNEQIAENLTSSGTFVTVDTIICADVAYGTFTNGDNTNLGMQNGLLLSSGRVLDAVGPNNQFGSGTGVGDYDDGDADLDTLSILNGNFSQSQDACIVELSVFANTPKLTFEYVFGSEEYPEFATPGSTVNDIFAFLISGPGIDGIPELNNQKNLAVLPNGDPVSILGVNNYNNWEYYRDNLNGVSLQYDGFTSDYLGTKKSLTATTAVEPCNTYKIKLVIGDRGDDIYDSGVFIGEITTGLPTTQLINADGLDYFVEGCSNSGSELNIILSEPFPDTTYLSLIPSGDAIIGTDYTMVIPSPLFVVPGQTVFSLPIDIINDAEDEGSESLTFALQIDYGCGAVTIDSVTSSINDVPLVEIQAGDSLTICGNECVELTVAGAVNYQWSPSQFFTPDTLSEAIFCPATTGWIVVEGNIGNLPFCQDTDSIFVTVPPIPEVNILASGITELCTGESVTLTAQNNLMDVGLTWSSTAPINDPSAMVQEVFPTGDVSYIATLQVEQCTDRDTIDIAFDDYYYPEFLVADTSLCQGDFLVMTGSVPNSNAIYNWEPADLLINPNNAATQFMTDTSGIFQVTLSAASENNFCGDTTTVNVTIDQISIDFLQSEPLGICLGESIDLEAVVQPATATFSWSSSTAIANPNSAAITVSPTMDDYFVMTVNTANCTLTDSIFVSVGELPIFDLEIFPDKDVYCENDQIVIQSEPNIDEGVFQGIIYQWLTPAPGLISPVSAENAVINVNQDFTYSRITNYKGCIDTSEIFVDMLEVDPIVISGVTDICQGDSTILTGVQTPVEPQAWIWSPTAGLSCIDCPNPIVNPTNTTTYTLGASTQGCFQTTNITVQVTPLPTVEFPTDNFICPGESIILNSINQSEYNYTWTSSPLDPTLNVNQATPAVSPNSATTYILNMTNGICPPLDTQLTIEIIDQVDLMIDPAQTEICEGDEEVTLEAISNVTGTFIWQPGNSEGASITISPEDTTTYSVQFDYGCGVLSDEATVNVVPVYEASIICEPDSTAFQEGQTIMLSVDSVFNTATYSWSNGASTTATSLQALNLEGESITLTINYGGFCPYEITKDFMVIPADITMPNAFTPDNDNQNDFFLPTTEAEIEIVDFKIWNRWGQMIYNNEDNLQGWDGYFNGKPAASDVYLFEVRFVRPNGTEEVFNGDVTLIR